MYPEQWSDAESKLLLDKYGQYLEQIGPLKKFKNKKNMWLQISSDMGDVGYEKTALQCENRYKTILKRKKKAIDNNRSTGAVRQNVQYEDELNKIKSIDDSVEPEVLRDINTVTKKRSIEGTTTTATTGKRKSMSDILVQIHKEKEKHRKEREENKMKRHNEKMELLKQIVDLEKNRNEK